MGSGWCGWVTLRAVTKLGEVLIQRGLYPLSAKVLYPLTTRRSGDDLVFLNWGYEESPPMGIPLEAQDEPHRYQVQLYHRVAAQADLRGRDVLEVSCGHGGGASYLTRVFKPASYTGLDANRAGIDFCRRRHPGVGFVHGGAENLPFEDGSFDAVINIEASHCYMRVPRFFDEVARVLRPGGDFLYADVRARDFIPTWEREIAGAPLKVVSETDISGEVARALPLIESLPQRMVRSALRGFRRGDSYRLYRLVK